MHSILLTNKRILLWLVFFIIIATVVKIEFLYRVCAGLLFVSCIIMGMREKSIINPYYLFALTPLSLCCYYSVSQHYMLDLSHETWVLSLINIYAFIFALNFTKPFFNKKKCIGINNKRNLRFHVFLLLGLSILAPLITPLETILNLFQVAGIVCAIKLKEKKIIALILIYIYVYLRTGMASKTDVLIYLMTAAIAYIKYYRITSKDKIKIILVGVIGALVMLFSFSFANKGKESRTPEEQLSGYMSSSNDIEWNFSAALFLPYMYLETPWSNVEYDLKTSKVRSNGLWMLKPILGYFGLDEKFKEEYSLYAYSAFNTFTFIPCGVRDFGYWFSVLSPLFLGFFVKKTYSRYKISLSPFDVACFVCVGRATLQMFFSNHFYMLAYPFTMFILMEIYKFFVVMLGKANIELEPVGEIRKLK